MSQLLIRHIDVGQGDCTVIMYWDHDTGLKRSFVLDCGEGRAYSSAYQLLRDHGFDKLDVAMITHYDEDHFIGFKHWLTDARQNALNGDYDLLHFFSDTKFWDRGDVRSFSAQGASISNNTTYTNYMTRLREVAELQRMAGIDVLKRMTRNMSRTLPSGWRKVTEEDLHLLGLNYENPNEWCWARLPNNLLSEFENPVPHEKIQNSWGRGSGNAYVLWKRKQWPIGLDVANFGFSDPIDLSIRILVGNGIGFVNEEARDVVIDPNDSPPMQDWKNSLGPMRTTIKASTNENELGMGYLLQYHDFRYWFGGDLTSGVEDALTDAIGQLSVLKAGHHGSKHSTSRRFLFETKPNVVCISTASESNDTVGLPHLETLIRLDESPEVENVYLTGAPYSDDMIPEYNDLYDPNRKFRVAGTRDYPADITLEVFSEDVVGDPGFYIWYHERNKFENRLGKGLNSGIINNAHQRIMPQ